MKKISRRLEKGMAHRIKTRSGKEIFTTKEHPFLLSNNKHKRAEILDNKSILKNVSKIHYETSIKYMNLIDLFEEDEIYKKKNGKFKLKFGRHWCPYYVKVDKNIARLFGFFTSEGSISDQKKYNLRCCFSTDEKEYISFVRSTIFKYFNIKTNLSIQGKSAVVSVWSKTLWLWFLKNGFAHNRFGKIIFNLAESLRWCFIDGYFDISIGRNCC